MSRHSFQVTVQESFPFAGATAQGCCGWDRPLQRFFFSLYAAVGDEQELLYNSLYEVAGVADPVDIQQKAAAVGVALPAGLLEALDDDADTNAGNKIVCWTEAGPEVLNAS